MLQELLGTRPADQASAQSRHPQQQPHVEAPQDAAYAENKVRAALPPVCNMPKAVKQ